jgi:hypothetical protein
MPAAKMSRTIKRIRPRPAIVALLVLAASACSTSIAVTRPLDSQSVNEINRRIRQREVVVVAPGVDRDSSSGEVTVGLDSTVIGERQQVPTAAIERITFMDRGRGALDGLGLGLLAGTAGGLIVGSLAASSTANKDCNASVACLYPFFGAAGGAILGVLIGPVVGAIVGHQTTIELSPPARGHR